MPKTVSLRQHLLSTAWVPWWLVGPNRGRVLWSAGAALDAGVEWLFQGLQEAYPSLCSPEALTWIGRDRRIQRGLNETDASYRRRLLLWLDAWRQAGTAFGIIGQAQSYFAETQTPTNIGPVMHLVQHNISTNTATWWTVSNDGERTFTIVDPSNWDWDSQAPDYHGNLRDTRFWVIIQQQAGGSPTPLFAPQEASGPTTPVSSQTIPLGSSIGSTVSADDLTRIASDWKMAGSWCAGVVIDYTAGFDFDGSGSGYPNGYWYRAWDPVANDYQRNRGAAYFNIRRDPTTYSDGPADAVIP